MSSDNKTTELNYKIEDQQAKSSLEEIVQNPKKPTTSYAKNSPIAIFLDIILNFTVPLLKTLYDEIKSLVLLKRSSQTMDDSTDSTSEDEEKSIGKIVGAGLGALSGFLLLLPSNVSLWLSDALKIRFPENLFATGNTLYEDALLGLLFLAATTIIGRTVFSVFLYVKTADEDYLKAALLGLVDGILGPKMANKLAEYLLAHRDSFDPQLISVGSQANPNIKDELSDSTASRRNSLLAFKDQRRESLEIEPLSEIRSRNNSADSNSSDPSGRKRGFSELDPKDRAFLRKQAVTASYPRLSFSASGTTVPTTNSPDSEEEEEVTTPTSQIRYNLSGNPEGE